MLVLSPLSPAVEAQEILKAVQTCFGLEMEREVHLRNASSFAGRREWQDKEVFLSLAGPDPSPSVRINGFPYRSEPANEIITEYRLTPFLKEHNTLELDSMVSATLLIRDAFHIRELAISTHSGMEENEFLFRFHLFLKSYEAEKTRGCEIQLEVSSGLGDEIFRASRALESSLAFGQETEMIIDLSMKNPPAWLPGKPELFDLKLSLETIGSEEPEVITTRFALMSFTFLDSLVVQKGDSIALSYPPDDLEAILPGLREEEILSLIEKHGINAIRETTPLSCDLRRLFLEYGILVVPEQD